MANNLEFKDCPACGKRMLTTAPKCHHCQHRTESLPRSRSARQAQSDTEDQDGYLQDSEMASSAGYAPEDQFDYDAYIANEFPEVVQPRQTPSGVQGWIVVTAWLVIMAMLLPFFWYFIVR